jgi:hypothetical protein
MNYNNTRYGNLPASGVKVLSGNELQLPATITLTSAAGGRAIELSNDGTNFFTPTYDANTASMISVSIKSPVKVYRITGLVGEQYSAL